jgi:hypothetical protein
MDLLERHYRVNELAKRLSVSTNTVRRMFGHESGVINLGARRTKRGRPLRRIEHS